MSTEGNVSGLPASGGLSGLLFLAGARVFTYLVKQEMITT